MLLARDKVPADNQVSAETKDCDCTIIVTSINENLDDIAGQAPADQPVLIIINKMWVANFADSLNLADTRQGPCRLERGRLSAIC